MCGVEPCKPSKAMRRKSKSLLAVLLASVGLMAQSRSAESVADPGSHAALKGCLTSTVVDGYRLMDDETGAVYRLVGNRENLRMLVGNDVLVTGHDLRTRQETGNGNNEEPENRATAHDQSANDPSDANSFQVVDALKVADVCVLSAAQSTASLTYSDH
jgi:hypothetical protein